MEISDNILSVVKKMEVPRLTLGELVAKLSNLRTVKEREAVLLEEVAYIIKPRSGQRTMKIAKSILADAESRPKGD